jgi:hypothetical protein
MLKKPANTFKNNDIFVTSAMRMPHGGIALGRIVHMQHLAHLAPNSAQECCRT